MLTAFTMLFSSCEDDSEKFVVSTPTAPVLAELSITNIELDGFNGNNPAVTFNWEDATYGVPTSVNYALQFSSDQAFTNPVTAATTTGNFTITLSVSELNAAAGNSGLNPFEWATLYTRVVASIGTQNSITANSNTIQFMVYPYFNYPFKDYYLVGDATAPGWNNNNNNPPVFRDPNNANKYTYTGYFGSGAFKVLEIKGLWQPQWGTNDGSTIEVNPGGGTDPNVFPVPAPGYYTFTIDFGTKTFQTQPYNASGAASFTSMSIQGSAVGNVTAINQLGHDPHIWYINSVRLVPGEVQFLTNTGSVWSSGTSFSGVATENGASIPVVVEDDYDVWFNDLTGEYILIPLTL